jgi:hypothetical protein
MGQLLNAALLAFLRQLEQTPDFSQDLLPAQATLRQLTLKAAR